MLSQRSSVVPALLVLAGLGLPGVALAQPAGNAFTYQGRLSDSGTPVSGLFDFQFGLFTAAVGGIQIGLSPTLGDVVVTNGLFTVNLDFGGSSFVGTQRFLEIGVRPGASTGAYTLLGARQELKPAPHAIHSQTTSWSGLLGKPAGFADDVDNDSGGDITAVTVGTGLSGGGTTGAVSLGLDFPVIAGNHNHFGQAWTGAAIFGLSVANSGGTGLGATSSTSNGISGSSTATGAWAGVLGSSLSSQGIGVRGTATASSGGVAGVEGSANSPNGTGVRGFVTATTGASIGVAGLSDSTAGIGVDGSSSAATGDTSGVRGLAGSVNGRGVYGLSLASSGSPIGVQGEARAPGGFGVYGWAITTLGTAVGVGGFTTSTAGHAVYGEAAATTGSPIGVLGETHATGGRAVWGNSFGSGFAGYFSGNVNVAGTLSKSAGSFRIDHPLDPGNKYLSHSFVESPDMMNVYNGNVVTDGDGFATLTLPEWFEALNRDFRYQLTVIDEDDSAGFVQVKVARKIADNRFSIRTSAPRTEVSWLVTGVRQDTYAEKHRIPVEEWKPEAERDRYVHPADWGLPAERGFDWERQLAASAIRAPEPDRKPVR